MSEPGRRNRITDVDGVRVGNAEAAEGRTGATVVLPDVSAVAAVEVRGGAPGTRETDALEPGTLVGCVDAVVLSGGSVFGLDAASGVASWLAAAGRGFAVGSVKVPVVPAAILFDMASGLPWEGSPPYHRLGIEACESAGADFALGNIGAGAGAVAGRLKGGLGSASALLDGGLQVGALVAANPAGSVVIPGTRTLWAWQAERNGEFGGMGPPPSAVDWSREETKLPLDVGANTTIGVVATNAALSNAEAGRVALMAHDGIARAVRPAHTVFDGDTLFTLATAKFRRPAGPVELSRIGALAADCVERAIGRAVYEAQMVGDVPALRSAG